jgi:hypothetical protein
MRDDGFPSDWLIGILLLTPLVLYVVFRLVKRLRGRGTAPSRSPTSVWSGAEWAIGPVAVPPDGLSGTLRLHRTRTWAGCCIGPDERPIDLPLLPCLAADDRPGVLLPLYEVPGDPDAVPDRYGPPRGSCPLRLDRGDGRTLRGGDRIVVRGVSTRAFDGGSIGPIRVHGILVRDVRPGEAPPPPTPRTGGARG